MNHAVIALALTLVLQHIAAFAAVGQAHPMLVPGPAARPMTLTDAQLDSFFTAVDELRALGDKTSAWKGGDPSKPLAMAQALKVSDETTAILRKHGFANHSEFNRVAYNAAMAYAVVKEGGKEAMAKKLDAAKAEQDKALEEMRKGMSPDEATMLSAQIEAAMKITGGMRDVPDENIELLKKYRERMEKIGTQ